MAAIRKIDSSRKVLRERPYLLGPNESMLGIATEPDGDPEAAAARPVMLLLNAGIVHRIGPHRTTVELARALAAAGFRSVRVDLSGIGDSPARRDALGFEAGARADIRELFDDLQSRFAAQTFVPMGLCSGADNSFYVALQDERVAGAVLLDGIAYRTRRYYLERYRGRLADPRAWLSVGKRALRAARKRLPGPLDALLPGGVDDRDTTAVGVAPPAVPDYVRAFEPRAVVARKFQSLCDRGVKTLWLYTGGTQLFYNYERQFFDMFDDVDFRGTVSHAYLGESNHTFTQLSSQRALTQTVTEWARTSFTS